MHCLRKVDRYAPSKIVEQIPSERSFQISREPQTINYIEDPVKHSLEELRNFREKLNEELKDVEKIIMKGKQISDSLQMLDRNLSKFIYTIDHECSIQENSEKEIERSSEN